MPDSLSLDRSSDKPSKPGNKPQTVKDFKEESKQDESWKKEPWIGDDGFEYRRQRVRLPNGSYKEFDVKVGRQPIKQTGDDSA